MRIVPALAVALLIHTAYQWSLGDDFIGRAGFLLSQKFSMTFVSTALVGALSSLMWFWIIVAGLFKAQPQNQRQIAACIVLILGVAFFVLDHTRVGVLLALPLIVYALQAHARGEFVLPLPARTLLLLSFLQGQLMGSIVLISNWPELICSLSRLW